MTSSRGPQANPCHAQITIDNYLLRIIQPLDRIQLNIIIVYLHIQLQEKKLN